MKSGTKNWSLFGIVGIHSSGTYLTLKVELVPEETTFRKSGVGWDPTEQDTCQIGKNEKCKMIKCWIS